MNWLIIIIAVFAIGTAIGAFLFYRKARSKVAAMGLNLRIIKREKDVKEKIASELFDLCLGLVERKVFEKKQEILIDLESDLKTESGRLSIAKAELESVQGRLSELEEVARELEASSLAASQELEMLRSQEKELSVKNQNLRVELDTSLAELDRLLEQLSSSQAAVDALNKTKSELLESQEKIIWYQERISEINMNYMQLKRAYDALDIEYAQLYEKQNA